MKGVYFLRPASCYLIKTYSPRKYKFSFCKIRELFPAINQNVATLLECRHGQRLGVNSNENARKFCFTCENGKITLRDSYTRQSRGAMKAVILKCFINR